MGNGATAATTSAQTRRRRAASASSVRRDLLTAAGGIVGKHGYAAASITRITKAVGIASGTFYLYFSSRQALFDRLLPDLGSKLVDHIAAHTDPSATGMVYEEQRIRAYFDFCRLNPGFLRIYHEAAIFAPKAYRAHFQRLADGYRQVVENSRAKGELPRFRAEELEALIHMLMGSRSYLSQLHGSKRGDGAADLLIGVYLKVIQSGVFGLEAVSGNAGGSDR